MERYRIVKSIFGGSDVYDTSGKKVGYSLPSTLGDGEDYYDMSGNPIGQSFESVFGGEWFSGTAAHGFIDQEFLMGQNAYLDKDPFEQKNDVESQETGNYSTGFNIDIPNLGGFDE